MSNDIKSVYVVTDHVSMYFSSLMQATYVVLSVFFCDRSLDSLVFDELRLISTLVSPISFGLLSGRLMLPLPPSPSIYYFFC
eukprot:m.192958 g.192958  ORF g.192958 m.192958 type:complete len:82 (+) comp14871_c1_seq1:1-246(+)